MPRSFFALLTLLIGGCAHVAEPERAGGSALCRPLALQYDTIRIGEDPVYVEPQTMSLGEGRLLITGRFRYRLTPAGTHYRPVDPPFGIVLGPQGSVATLPSPLEGRTFDALRAVPVPGGWAVVFAEIQDRGGARDSALALWYGEIQGLEWRRLEQIPAGSGGFRFAGASRVLPTPEGLVWVVPVSDPEYGLLVLRLLHGRWTIERVPTSAPRAEPVLMPGGTLALLLMQADSTFMTDDSSILLRRREAGWAVTQVLNSGQTEPARDIAYSSTGTGGVLSWWGRPGAGELRLRARTLGEGAAGPPLTVDTGVTGLQPLSPISMENGDVVWGTTRRDSTASAVRLHLMRQDSIHLLTEFRDPFVGGFGMVARGDTVVLVGAVAVDRRYFANLVVRIPVQCGSART